MYTDTSSFSRPLSLTCSVFLCSACFFLSCPLFRALVSYHLILLLNAKIDKISLKVIRIRRYVNTQSWRFSLVFFLLCQSDTMFRSFFPFLFHSLSVACQSKDALNVLFYWSGSFQFESPLSK